MELLIGLDIGTTAEKIALFDKTGKTLAISTQEYSLITPKINFVEEDPAVYWTAFKAGIENLKKQYPMKSDDSYALAISAQGETLFFIDAFGKPLRNAIVWMDNRATDEAQEMKKVFGDERCYHTTGQVSFEACWPASKIMWVKKNEPDVFAKTKTFALIEDYFIYRMTGIWATEGSLVCSSTYWNIITKQYWKEMLDYIGIQEEQLPPVQESGQVIGRILPDVADELGLSHNLTVCTGCLDQVAGAIGIGNIHEGMFSENIGAALAIVCPVSKPLFDPARRMPLHYFATPDTYMIHTFSNGGMTLRWYRDKMCQPEMLVEQLSGLDAYKILDREVDQAPAGSDGLIMLPHLTGSMAPDVNIKAKGVWFGFTLQHTKAHFVRSILESLGYMIKRNLDSLANMGINVKEIRSSGGGSKSPVWNQISSDILGVDLITMQSEEAASLGAAILAGKATGLFPSLEAAVDNMAVIKDRYTPNPENREVYDQGYQMYQKLFADLGECFERGI
jgi:xylulokinase